MNLLPYFTGKKPSGFIVVTDPTLPSGKYEGSTRMCAHCGNHWEYKPGSRRKYGVCVVCGGYVCNRKKCNEKCSPLAENLELVEEGLKRSL